jgi:hypothetical protein
VVIALLVAWVVCGLAGARFTFLTVRAWESAEWPPVSKWYAWVYVSLALLSGPGGVFATLGAFERKYWRF